MPRVVAAFALADAAEVETEHGVTGIAQRPRHAVDHLVVHGPAEQRMGMADQGYSARIGIFRRFQQGFELTSRAIQQVGFNASRHRYVLGIPGRRSILAWGWRSAWLA